MKLSHTTLKLLTAATSLASAFKVPDSLPDGVYTLSYDPASGEALSELELLQPSLARRNNRLAPLVARQNADKPPPLERPRPTCGKADMNRNDFDAAKAEFEKLCDIWKVYPAHNAVIITQGRAIAYMCSFDAENRCWRDEYEEASGILDRQCGNRRTGAVYVEKWRKTYGRDVAGVDICASP